jgi:ketosteroid isomerase-like protein
MNEDHSADARASALSPLKRGLALTSIAVAATCITPAAAEDAAAVLIARAAEKNAAFMDGDMDRWMKLVRMAPDFTLMEPFGGPASQGFDTSPERMASRAKYFQNADTELEVAATYASDAMIVLVMIERQRGEVGGLPKQDWSLRVTEVYRKDGADWVLAHRHADPLVHRLTLKQAATIARGLPAEE